MLVTQDPRRTSAIALSCSCERTSSILAPQQRDYDLSGCSGNYCAGYVAGMTDALVATGHACIPAEVTVQQAVDVVIKYLRDHSEQRQYPAWYIGRRALSLRFPCN